VQRWTDVAEVPAALTASVVTLGTFDGVHAGHRAVLNRVVEQARAHDRSAIAVTFDPHPLHVLRPDRAPEQLTSLAHRLRLLAASGLTAELGKSSWGRTLASAIEIPGMSLYCES
jgi:riboflavin kinase / FMN adenylyltransferase